MLSRQAEPKEPKPKFKVYDSDLELEYPDHNIFACVYEPIWQWTRFGLRFKAFEDARAACARLDAYVMTAPPEELQYRVWRVFILLSSIPHGRVYANTGLRQIERDAAYLLIQQNDVYRKKVEEVGRPTFWDWAVTRANATTMFQNQPRMLLAPLKEIHANRMHRTKKQSKRMYVHYRNICEDVMEMLL